MHGYHGFNPPDMPDTDPRVHPPALHLNTVLPPANPYMSSYPSQSYTPDDQAALEQSPSSTILSPSSSYQQYPNSQPGIGPFDPADPMADVPPPRSPKRKRSRVNPDQLARLEQLFAVDRSPTASRRKEIGAELGMQERQTQIWFQNRRAKAKVQEGRGKPRTKKSSSANSTPGQAALDQQGSACSSDSLRLSISHSPINIKVEEDDSDASQPGPGSPGYPKYLTKRFLEGMPISVIPCSSLRIGTWRTVTDPSLERELVAYIAERRRALVWFISYSSRNYKMEVPLDAVQSTHLSFDTRDLGSGCEPQARVEVRLAHAPNFFHEVLPEDGLSAPAKEGESAVASGSRPGRPPPTRPITQWQPCADFTRDAGGPTARIHEMQGPAHGLYEVVSRLPNFTQSGRLPPPLPLQAPATQYLTEQPVPLSRPTHLPQQTQGMAYAGPPMMPVQQQQQQPGQASALLPAPRPSVDEASYAYRHTAPIPTTYTAGGQPVHDALRNVIQLSPADPSPSYQTSPTHPQLRYPSSAASTYPFQHTQHPLPEFSPPGPSASNIAPTASATRPFIADTLTRPFYPDLTTPNFASAQQLVMQLHAKREEEQALVSPLHHQLQQEHQLQHQALPTPVAASFRRFSEADASNPHALTDSPHEDLSSYDERFPPPEDQHPHTTLMQPSFYRSLPVAPTSASSAQSYAGPSQFDVSQSQGYSVDMPSQMPNNYRMPYPDAPHAQAAQPGTPQAQSVQRQLYHQRSSGSLDGALGDYRGSKSGSAGEGAGVTPEPRF